MKSIYAVFAILLFNASTAFAYDVTCRSAGAGIFQEKFSVVGDKFYQGDTEIWGATVYQSEDRVDVTFPGGSFSAERGVPNAVYIAYGSTKYLPCD